MNDIIIDEITKNVKGKVMLSGYNNELYNSLNWKKFEFEKHCYAIAKTRTTKLKGIGKVKEIGKRIECVWINYEPPQLELLKEKTY